MSSSDKKVTPYHHGQLRQALLDGSRALIVESGLESLTLRAVARRIGVSTAAPYHHFQSRAEVIAALVRENFETLDAYSSTAIEGHTSTHAKLQALGMVYVTYALEHTADFRLMFRPELSVPPAPSELERAPVFRVLLNVLRESHLDPNRLEVTALTVWSLVHGLATLLVDGPLHHLTQQRDVINELVANITRGVHFKGLEP
jgi:AcrR family transcriptional regulator